MAVKTAIILAGGEGTRLRPYTLTTPKALIDINGKTLSEHVINILKRHGVTNIILSIGYMAEKVMDYFGDGSDFGVRISYAVEEKPMGTAGPFLILPKIKSTFFCINGDNLFRIDLKKMLEFHKKQEAAVTIALTEVSNPSAYGIAKMNGSKIIEFVEKPAPGTEPSMLINSGYYIMEPIVFDLVKSLGKDFVMLERDVFPKLAEEGRLFGYPDKSQWFDTGTLERWEEAKKKWKGI